MTIHRIHLTSCDSTQDAVRERLVDAEPGDVVAVTADTQTAGRGRQGRSWENPPGAAIMASVGRLGPIDAGLLDELPRRIAGALLDVLDAGDRIRWSAPNDLVDADGAKLAGILVDARTLGTQVELVIVGVGINVAGGSFTTRDGRSATTLEALGVTAPDAGAVVSVIGGVLTT